MFTAAIALCAALTCLQPALALRERRRPARSAAGARAALPVPRRGDPAPRPRLDAPAVPGPRRSPEDLGGRG